MAAPGAGCAITLWLQGGAISHVAPDAMAFTGREAPFWLGVEAEWDDASLDQAHIDWGRTTMTALQPFTAAGHYVNDMVESGEAVVRSIYGDAKYERLVGLKRHLRPRQRLPPEPERRTLRPWALEPRRWGRRSVAGVRRRGTTSRDR